MTCILSTLGIVETGFWPLSIIDIDFFRETFVFTYFFLCGSSGPMRYQCSQFVPNSSLHVTSEINICFQAIILKGVNLIINNGDGALKTITTYKIKYCDFFCCKAAS